MTDKSKDNPRGDKPGKKSPNEPAGQGKDTDPHPDTEEGYDRNTKIPATGL